MHVLSKVLLGMVILMAVIAVIFTSKLRAARGEWLKRIDERQASLATRQEDLRKKRLNIADARDEVNRLMSQWGNSWQTDGQVVNPQQGTIALNVGGNAGLGRREVAAGSQLPTVYPFAVSQQGESKFLGQFRATAIEAGQTAAELVRTPYQGEAQNWPAGQWRVRESIPSQWRAVFSGLQARTAEALQDVQDQQKRLEMAEQMIAKSQEQLQRRLAQLDGKPDAIEGSSEEVLNGLVASLRELESARNSDLTTLNDLRHEYDRKYRQLTAMLEENRQLESALPQPDSSTPVDDGPQAVQTSTEPSRR